VHRSIKQLAIALGLAATLYAACLALLSDASPRAALSQLLSWTGLQAAALCLFSYFLRGMRWRAWMARYGRPLGVAEGLRLYVAGYAFTPTPGNVGEAVRGLWLAQRPLGAAQSLAIFGAERLADLACLMLMASPVLIAWLWRPTFDVSMSMWWLALLAALVVAAVMAAALRRYLAKPHAARLSWLREAWTCLSARPLHWVALTLGAWLAQGLAVWLVCAANGLSIGAWQAAGLYAVAMIGGALSALPAGLGGTEAIMAGLLVAQGATGGMALTVTVVVRVLTLWLAVGLGLFALGYSAAIRKDIRLS
jgi:glycosyltransferase 2 family protein